MGKIIIKKAIKIRPQFLYYITDDGNICEQIRAGYKSELENNELEKKIIKMPLKKRDGYLYYISRLS